MNSQNYNYAIKVDKFMYKKEKLYKGILSCIYFPVYSACKYGIVVIKFA